MPFDKKLALRLVDELEELYLEHSAMKSVLMTLEGKVPQAKEWKQFVNAMKADPEARSRVRAQFAQLRERIQQDQSLADAIQAFLRVVPASREIQ